MSSLAALTLLGCASPEAPARPVAPRTEKPEAPAEVPAASDLEAKARDTLDNCLRGADFLELWASLDDAEREALAGADDTGVALQARWELERRVVVGDESPFALDPDGIERFLAFVAERTGAPPPAFWSEALRSARFDPNTGVTSYWDWNMPTLRADRIGEPIAWGERRIQAVRGVTLDVRGDGLFVQTPSGAAILGSEALGDEHAIDLHVLWLAPDSIVAAPLVAGIGFPYVASRWDSGARRWSTEVCGGGRQLHDDSGAGYLEIVRHGELALFFGAERHAVYVDALRLDDGTLAYRFNSDLWFARRHIGQETHEVRWPG